jgi:hypothetical protein
LNNERKVTEIIFVCFVLYKTPYAMVVALLLDIYFTLKKFPLIVLSKVAYAYNSSYWGGKNWED